MELVGLNTLLEEARKGHYAVGAFNYCNMETVQAVIETGCELRSPIILIAGPWEISLLGVKHMTAIAKLVAKEADVPVCLHLDHATELSLVETCINEGFPSVMMDASEHSFEENIRLTKQVVELAHARGVTVEGELGAIGRADGISVEGSNETTLADPDEAAEFAERTGVEALAVSIGNAHGMYPQQPQLNFDLLQAITRKTDVPLVLHGGSGTPTDQLHQAVDLGITKVNVASELAKAYMNVLHDCAEQKIWYAHALVKAKSAVKDVVASWMHELGCAGKAR